MKRPITRTYQGDGTFIDREMNDAEYKQYQLDQETNAQMQAELQAQAEAKAVAQAKLAALGLTVDDLRALGL
jgi:hypothetical protein